jgi:hypothetical protein
MARFLTPDGQDELVSRELYDLMLHDMSRVMKPLVKEISPEARITSTVGQNCYCHISVGTSRPYRLWVTKPVRTSDDATSRKF